MPSAGYAASHAGALRHRSSEKMNLNSGAHAIAHAYGMSDARRVGHG